MRIALVHDWFIAFGGSERVVQQILQVFPEADLFSLLDFLPEAHRGFLEGRSIHTSFLQKLPFARLHYRLFLPLMPFAIEQFDLSGYDLVLSSSHAVAKGVLTGPHQLHIAYIHSPMRYVWDMQHEYLRDSSIDRGWGSLAARWTLHKMRQWDYRSANGVDYFIANSNFIARRVWKTYRRHSVVIYPPVDVVEFDLPALNEAHNGPDFYLAASRIVPYKKMELIVEAFAAMPQKRLVVIGEGPGLKRLKAKARQNVEVLGYQPLPVLRRYMQHAKAFIFAAQDDFGIAPLEAQACGTPVIAFRRGGAVETLRGLDLPNPTALFFEEQSVEALIQAVQTFEHEQHLFDPQACRKNAERFSAQRFRQEFRSYFEAALHNFSLLDTGASTGGPVALPRTIK